MQSSFAIPNSFSSSCQFQLTISPLLGVVPYIFAGQEWNEMPPLTMLLRGIIGSATRGFLL